LPTIQGKVIYIRSYEQDGGTNWFIVISKLCWYAICVIFPFAIFRLLKDLFNVFIAIAGIGVLLFLIRLIGPINLVMLDELLSRIFPALRSGVRSGRIPVYDFRLRQSDSSEIACILRGPLTGSTPAVGDNMMLQGDFISGSFIVSGGVIDNTGAVLARQTEFAIYLLFLTLILLGFFILYLKGYLDEWLYPLLTGIIQTFLGAF
jgi:hypothetical protein